MALLASEMRICFENKCLESGECTERGIVQSLAESTAPLLEQKRDQATRPGGLAIGLGVCTRSDAVASRTGETECLLEPYEHPQSHCERPTEQSSRARPPSSSRIAQSVLTSLGDLHHQTEEIQPLYPYTNCEPCPQPASKIEPSSFLFISRCSTSASRPSR